MLIEISEKDIFATIQRNKFESILFLINTSNELKEFKLKINTLEEGDMKNIFTDKLVSKISNGESSMKMDGSEVKILRIIE